MRWMLCIGGLLLASCGEPQAAQGPEPAKTDLAPGKWRIEAAIDSIDAAGLPPEEIEAIKQERQIGTEICLTAAEVSRPPSRFFTALRHECSYERLDLSGGKVSAALRCSIDDVVQSMELDGTYGPVAYEIHENHVIEHPASGQRMSIVLTGRGRRTGEC